MFKAIRISILLFILFMVTMSTWLTQARSTDWNNSLWVKIYPINADGSAAATEYIERLKVEHFGGCSRISVPSSTRTGRFTLFA